VGYRTETIQQVEQPNFMDMLVVENGFFHVLKEKGLFTYRERSVANVMQD